MLHLMLRVNLLSDSGAAHGAAVIRCLQTLQRAARDGAGLHARAVRQALGVKRDLFGLLPGRQTFVFDKAGRNALVFRSQLNAEQHIAEALKVVRALA